MGAWHAAPHSARVVWLSPSVRHLGLPAAPGAHCDLPCPAERDRDSRACVHVVCFQVTAASAPLLETLRTTRCAWTWASVKMGSACPSVRGSSSWSPVRATVSARPAPVLQPPSAGPWPWAWPRGPAGSAAHCQSGQCVETAPAPARCRPSRQSSFRHVCRPCAGGRVCVRGAGGKFVRVSRWVEARKAAGAAWVPLALNCGASSRPHCGELVLGLSVVDGAGRCPLPRLLPARPRLAVVDALCRPLRPLPWGSRYVWKEPLV